MYEGKKLIQYAKQDQALCEKRGHDPVIHVTIDSCFGMRPSAEDFREALKQARRHIDNVYSANLVYETVEYVTANGSYDNRAAMIETEALDFANSELLYPTYTLRYKRREDEEHWTRNDNATWEEVVTGAFDYALIDIGAGRFSEEQQERIHAIRNFRAHLLERNENETA